MKTNNIKGSIKLDLKELIKHTMEPKTQNFYYAEVSKENKEFIFNNFQKKSTSSDF